LKAAILYGDEVLLHSPTALLLAALADITKLPPDDFISFLREVAPALGETGTQFSQQIAHLESSLGPDQARTVLRHLLDEKSGLSELIAPFDAAAAGQLREEASFAKRGKSLIG
jgi:hypothetical protein